MYLTRAFLDPASPLVRADLRNPEGRHKTVMRAFPDAAGPTPRGTHAVLHRVDQERGERVVLLVQSRTKPMTERWPAGYLLEIGDDFDLGFSTVGENPAIRNVAAERSSIPVGARFVFRLCANTTRKIDTKTGPDGTRRNGRRVPVRGDDKRREWLVRRASAAGFEVVDHQLRITEVGAAGGRGGKSVTVAGTQFDGVLVVRDADRFRMALEAGIGPAKGYGFGLLSIAPVR